LAGLPPIEPPPIEEVRVVLGPQQRFFSSQANEQLINSDFVVGTAFDRMGRKLEGPRLPPLSLDMPSEPAVRGSLQVDGEGALTVLLADHQTTGGYPKIAVVIDPDIDRLAQLESGRRVRFRAVSQAEGIAIVRQEFAAAEMRLRQLARRETFSERLQSASLISGMVSALAS
jgi:allophanate hydrolase